MRSQDNTVFVLEATSGEDYHSQQEQVIIKRYSLKSVLNL